MGGYFSKCGDFGAQNGYSKVIPFTGVKRAEGSSRDSNFKPMRELIVWFPRICQICLACNNKHGAK